MKNSKNKLSFVAVLLSVFLLSACQQDQIDESCSRLETSTSSVSQSSSDTSGTSSGSIGGQAYVRDRDNGVIVIEQIYESTPLEGLAFKVDSLNEEFILELRDLYTKDENKRVLSSVNSLFLADVNKDGYDDFIYTCSSRLMKEAGTFVVVYDYHNGKELYRLDEPNEFDYTLVFTNHQILVNQHTADYYESKNYFEVGRLVGEGVLDYSGSEITTNWNNFLNLDSMNMRVTTADALRTPMALKRGQEENTLIIEHARADKAYCITTNAVRNSGNYDDLPGELPVGYRLLSGFSRIVQSIANNHQDNVIVVVNPAMLSESGDTSASLELSVSGATHKIVFEFENLDYSADAHTLKGSLGWNFSKESLEQYSHEYIPGKMDEHDYPFMYVSVARSGDATKASYNLLEGVVAEIDPALVRADVSMEHYIFKADGETYTFDGYGPYLKNGGDFYMVLYSKDYSWANSNSEGYLRFRDNRTEVSAMSVAYTESGLYVTTKVITNATAILFDRREVFTNTNLERGAKYTLEIAGNTFYIKDAKTMVKGRYEYTVVSEHDFSSLFE